MADFQAWSSDTHPIVKLEDDWNNLLKHGLEKAATFVVRINGSYYEAISGYSSTAGGTIIYGGEDNANGISGTDAHAVLQNCATACDVDGGVIFVKRGTYPLDDFLKLGDNTVLCGEGAKTILQASSIPVDLEYGVLTNNDHTNGNFDIAVMNLAVDGNSEVTNGIRFEGTATSSKYCERVTFQNLYIKDCGYHGYEIHSGRYCYVNNIVSNNCGTAVGLYHNAKFTRNYDSSYTNHFSYDSGGDGFKFNIGARCSFDNIIIQNPAERGFNLSGATAIADCVNMEVSNLFVDTSANAYTAVYVNYARDISLTNVSVSSWTGYQNILTSSNTENIDIVNPKVQGGTGQEAIEINGDYVTIVGGSLQACSEGVRVTANGSNVQVLGVKFRDNTGNALRTLAGAGSVKVNRCIFNGNTDVASDSATTILGDLQVIAPSSLDLSGAGTDILVWNAPVASFLMGYNLLYTEASSADAGVTVEIGRYQDGVALDDNYFDQSTSEINKNLGYMKSFASTDLSNRAIAAGDAVTCGTIGGKVGAGEVQVTLNILYV
jgi:hypothetical protein